MVVKNNAFLLNGSHIPLNRLEVRIVNPDFIDPPTSRISRRDIRADSLGGRIDGAVNAPIPGSSGTLVYDSGTGTSFSAIFRGLNPEERQLAISGQTRVMGWQRTTAAGDRLGMTIYEVVRSAAPVLAVARQGRMLSSGQRPQRRPFTTRRPRCSTPPIGPISRR